MDSPELNRTCRFAQHTMQESLDRPLTTAERAGLDAHVDTCDGCRTEWADLRRVDQVASAWVAAGGHDPGDEFMDRLMSRIAAEGPAEPARRPWPAGWLAAGLAVIGAAAAGWVLPPVELPPAGLTQVWPAIPQTADLAVLLHGMADGAASAVATLMSVAGTPSTSGYCVVAFGIALAGSILLAAAQARRIGRAR
ncbi:MAG: anti-sigma factor family protein [Capsulimonadaceae bacterium]